ncbi:hypothetical protein [Rubrobacter marinus]|nr:hypothetical protein [Rubrobacter marinus]
MRKPVYIASRSDRVLCPACGIDELRRDGGGGACCERCNRAWART